MSALSAVSDTLYIPLLGRVYASRCHPEVLYDEAALTVYDSLTQSIKDMPGQTEYTSLASAVRSLNMDYYIQAFLAVHPDAVIVNIGCGLETLYQRNDNGTAIWYELDLPEVLALRRRYFPPAERDRYLACSMFDYDWIHTVQQAEAHSTLIIASGLFLYFPEEQVLDLIHHLAAFPGAMLVFDTVSPAGLKIARRMIVKMGKRDAQVFFCVHTAKALTNKLFPGVRIIGDRNFYSLLHSRSKLAYNTRFRMIVSDLFRMVKIICLKFP